MTKLPLYLHSPLPESKKWILESVSEVLKSPPAEKGFLYLDYSSDGLALIEVGPLKPLRVDFIEGELRHKRKQGIGKGSLLGKALGLTKGYKKILDGNLGLGHDSWLFLCMGLQVMAFEKSIPVFMLTKDALERAGEDLEVSHWLNGRLQIQNADVSSVLERAPDATSTLEQAPDAELIYFDFMFPEKKKALPKKSMQLLAKLDLEEKNEKAIIQKALKLKVARVVVKRPLKAPPILEKPSHTFEGNSIRYDVYIPRR